MNPPAPWFQQPDEPDDAWQGFVQFRDQALPRAVRRVAGFRAVTQIEWSQKYKWHERAKAWDQHCEEIRIAEREALLAQEGKALAAEHMLLLKDARELAQRELAKYLESSRENDMPGLIKPSDLIKLTEAVVKLDRLVRGEHTEKTEHEIDLSDMPIEELRQFAQTAAKLDKA